MDKNGIGKFFGKKSTLLKLFKYDIVGFDETRYVYVDNEAPVLLVAHIDTVQKPRLEKWNTGAGFDDRLGCFLGYQLVNKYPQWFDLLLTDYEETGNSTAEFFEPSHEYNFVVELDREGMNYVAYGLACDEMKLALEMCGLDLEYGTYSDILELDHLKCSKINLGIGCYNSHGLHSGFQESVTDSQIEKLLNFVELFHEHHFAYNNEFDWMYEDDDDEEDYIYDGKYINYGQKAKNSTPVYLNCGYCSDPYPYWDMEVLDDEYYCEYCASLFRHSYNEDYNRHHIG